jgi:ribonuclease T1
MRGLAKWLWPLAAALLAAVALARGDLPQQTDIRLQDLPVEARQTLQLIQRGGPFPFERDGVSFGNYENLLPAASRGHYREYTVVTPGLKHRGARRIVVGCERQRPAAASPGTLQLAHCRDGGVFYYTADHYRSFRRIVE